MTLSLVLVVFVSASEMQAPATVALQHAAQEVLGSDAEVLVRGTSEVLGDAELSEAGRGVDAAAEVTWQDADQQHARVHCYLEASHRFVNRELVFDDKDELRERGRMLGFAIASMLPERLESPERPAPPEKETADSSQRPVTSPERVPRADRLALTPNPEDEPTTAPSHPRRTLGAIDVAALTAIASGSDDGSLGVGVAARWLFHRSLSLRLAGGIRYGNIEVARARSEFFFGGLGLGFQFTSPDPHPRFVFGGRVDALLTANTLRRSRTDAEVPESQTRLQPATDLLLEGAWYFFDSTALLLASGGEFGLGHTDVVVQGKEIADVAAFRWVAELGMRARF
jgi:hypothetical protein